jgi:hypothetical protein
MLGDREVTMAQLWNDVTEKIKQLAGSWTSFSALGSVALYVLGYLTLRFHLTALGVGTDLAVLDERYLFAGAKFLVYLVSSIPIVIFMLLVAGGFVYLPYRLLARGMRDSVRAAASGLWEKITVWVVRTETARTGRNTFFRGDDPVFHAPVFLLQQPPARPWPSRARLDAGSPA